ncbi:hypothetical protein Xsto_03477 [Xenorhabdus stockiae]|uniref:Uncharacterized protein n=1 Tax=Xenorhabdus stockiae TaxID=351614 RepID=A0A2D0KL42_9GAMM|nr:hypothetical protein [Xenorhabdus stockiae]PHM63947.1 hypothetical protein Xsto_03477 [Xenorhabdus stockiae]
MEFLNYIKKILHDYAPIISLLCFLLGLYIGNKQAIGRDRRKEFNTAVAPLRKTLRRQIERIEQRKSPYPPLSKDDFYALYDVTYRFQRIKLLQLWKAYQKADSESYRIEHSSSGKPFATFISPEQYLKAAKGLLDFMGSK